MLHIITALYRYENLPKIYSSILISDKITWHISKISSKPDPEYDFIKKDKMIKLYTYHSILYSCPICENYEFYC